MKERRATFPGAWKPKCITTTTTSTSANVMARQGEVERLVTNCAVLVTWHLALLKNKFVKPFLNYLQLGNLVLLVVQIFV
jgi:hypothetical protein